MGKVTRIGILVVVIVVIAMNWAAINNIRQGQPDLTLEYVMLAVTIPLFFTVTLFVQAK